MVGLEISTVHLLCERAVLETSTSPVLAAIGVHERRKTPP
jgi:hypothetical protein